MAFLFCTYFKKCVSIDICTPFCRKPIILYFNLLIPKLLDDDDDIPTKINLFPKKHFVNPKIIYSKILLGNSRIAHEGRKLWCKLLKKNRWMECIFSVPRTFLIIIIINFYVKSHTTVFRQLYRSSTLKKQWQHASDGVNFT